MYCIQCGVELSPGQKVCPLCHTTVYHPDLPQDTTPPAYPQEDWGPEEVSPRGLLVIVTCFALLCATLPLLSELIFFNQISWSGYVTGGVTVGYLVFVLPSWFQRPSPAIFAPCDFLAIMLFLHYINGATGGHWFLTFAFPITGILGLIITAFLTLLYYLRRGKLYIFGGTLMALGLWVSSIELFLWVTFDMPKALSWSLFPMIALVLLGGMLLVIAMVKPWKEALARRFFI